MRQGRRRRRPLRRAVVSVSGVSFLRRAEPGVGGRAATGDDPGCRDAGLQDLADEWLIVPTDKARTPGLKVASLIVKTPQPREWPGTTGISPTRVSYSTPFVEVNTGRMNTLFSLLKSEFYHHERFSDRMTATNNP